MYSVVASYNYAQFPFDNACLDENYDGSVTAGSYTLDNGETVVVSEDEDIYKYCNQELIRFNPAPYPATSAIQTAYEWMSEGQANFADIFGWFSIVMFVIVATVFLFRAIRLITTSCIGRSYNVSIYFTTSSCYFDLAYP